jgi:hypothetical protein
MKLCFAVIGSLFLSLTHAQRYQKLSPSQACRDIDSLCHWYVDQTAVGCNPVKSDFFRRACEQKKSTFTDSISIHQFAFELAEIIASCNDAHFALDWIYLNRKFPRGNGFFPYRYTATKGPLNIHLVITDSSPNSKIHGAEWLELNGITTTELIEWAGHYVSVEEGAEQARDYLAACWLPWLLAQSDHLFKDNEWSLRVPNGVEIIRNNWKAIDIKQLEQNHGSRKSIRGRSEISYSVRQKKAILKIPTFAPKSTLRGLRKINRFFRWIKLNGVESILIDLRDNGGGNSAFVEYLYSFLDTAGVAAPHAIVQRSSELSRKRLHPWIKNGILRRRILRDEDGMAAMRVMELPNEICDTVYLKERIIQKQNQVYQGRCFVAVNGQTASAAGHFAALMQSTGRGKIIGQTCNANSSDSGGNAMRVILGESRLSVLLPLIRYINFEVNNSVRNPIIPDIELWPNIHDISQQYDVIINRYIQHE